MANKEASDDPHMWAWMLGNGSGRALKVASGEGDKPTDVASNRPPGDAFQPIKGGTHIRLPLTYTERI